MCLPGMVGGQTAGVPVPPVAGVAAELHVTAQVSPTTLEVGQQGVYQIELRGEAPSVDQYPERIEVAELAMEFQGVRESRLQSGNEEQRIVTLRYGVRGDKAGVYEVPGQRLVIGGQVVMTNAVTLTVKEGVALPDAEQPYVQLQPERTEVWQGECVPLTVSIVLPASMGLSNQGPPVPVVAGDGVILHRFERMPQAEALQSGNSYLKVYRMQTAMVASKAGDILLGPADVNLDLVVSRGGVPDHFGGFPSYRRMTKLTSAGVPLKVKELPREGRPEGFDGAVGQFELGVRTDAHGGNGGVVSVALGEPLVFDLTVAGTGDFDSVKVPALADRKGVRVYPGKVAFENRNWGIEYGSRGWTQILFPEAPGPLEVVFMSTFFHPGSGRYETVKSEPFKFTVTGDARVAAESKENSADTRDYSGVGAALPEEGLEDILPQMLPLGMLQPLAGRPAVVPAAVLHGAFGILLGSVVWLALRKRWEDQRAERAPLPGAPRAPKEVLTELRGGQLSRGGFYGLVSEFFHARQWHGGALSASAEIDSLMALRDRWLYAQAEGAEGAREQIPAEERATALSTLARLL